MDNTELAKLLMKYISIWFWMQFSISFLIGSLIIFSVSENIKGQIIFVAFFLLFIISQIFVGKRIREVLVEE